MSIAQRPVRISNNSARVTRRSTKRKFPKERSMATKASNSTESLMACIFNAATCQRTSVSINPHWFWPDLFFISLEKSKYGFSIYDGEFADESFHINHTVPGLLGMCKRGGCDNTNESQFYISLAPLNFLDGKNVVFGRIIDGFNCFKTIDSMIAVNEKPFPACKIENAGIFKLDWDKIMYELIIDF